MHIKSHFIRKNFIEDELWTGTTTLQVTYLQEKNVNAAHVDARNFFYVHYLHHKNIQIRHFLY